MTDRMLPEIRIYDTARREALPFEPIDSGRVGMYVCGPTVQSDPHVGHGRSAVAFDVVRRYLTWRGFDVTFVRNITDVEDKIIAAAAETGESTDELAMRVAESFADAFQSLSVLEPDVEPKATAHIPEMIELIERLIDRGLAYPAENADVYFSVRTLEGYGRLSGRNPDELRSGARIEISEAKHDPLDFALWKAAKPGEPSWDSPWGHGRPGWHIECSAMASKYLGDTFDIHGGGSDLIFPHHENEIAQSEGASGELFARFWMHNGMVNLGGEKMSKSTGHVVGLHEAIDRHGGPAVRLFYLRAHYRSPLEFSDTLLQDAQTSLERVHRLMERAPRVGGVEPAAEFMRRFVVSMNDDFSTPEAVGVLFDAVREANRALDASEDAGPVVEAVHEMVEILALGPVASDETDDGAILGFAGELGLDVEGGADDAMERILVARSDARIAKDWARSDQIRDGLAEIGIIVEDTPDGSRWYRR